MIKNLAFWLINIPRTDIFGPAACDHQGHNLNIMGTVPVRPSGDLDRSAQSSSSSIMEIGGV